MTSKASEGAYVWVWLPGREAPVVAGRLDEREGEIGFVYGRTYRENPDAIPLYLPELPLVEHRIRPLDELDAPNCIEDAGPDAWGRRVIANRLVSQGETAEDPADLPLMSLLLESGSDRVGALDFQASADEYVPRDDGRGTLEELAASAERVEKGIPLSPELDRALIHGTSIGGARPKALIDDGSRRMIAKFSSSDDSYAIVQGEFVAMELGRLAGLDIAPVQLEKAHGKHAILVERFDRICGTDQRLAVVSALTMLELNEIAARWASYAELAQIIRERFTRPAATLRELFSRITFNILVGNTDDHARNHSAFWDGEMLSLTPAYDVCPQPRSGGRATQAMIIGEEGDGFKESQVVGCVERAHLYHLTEAEGREIVDHQIDTIEAHWAEVCEIAELSEVERGRFWRRQFLNPYALENY